MSDSDFDQLVQEALAQDFSGWDFSSLHGRWSEEDPPWAYEALVAEEKEHTASSSLPKSLIDKYHFY